MTLGGVLLLTATDRLLDPVSPRGVTVAAVGAGLVLWSFGVLQKETSLCALALAPFLWPLLRAQRGRWHLLGAGRRRLLGAIGAGVLLPFVPMAVRTVQLSLADDRVYESFAAGRSLRTRFWDQVVNADEALDTQLFGVLAVAAVAALAANAALAAACATAGAGGPAPIGRSPQCSFRCGSPNACTKSRIARNARMRECAPARRARVTRSRRGRSSRRCAAIQSRLA
jgi:hypothetical protein